MRTPVTGPTETQPIEETAPPIKDLSFDDALAELQRTIAELESGNLPLERTLLRSAELRMRQLVAKGGGLETVAVTEDRTVDEG
jgi:exonuclease VII small subunit